MQEFVNQMETELNTGEREMPDNRGKEEIIFDEIIADINEKLEEANYYYKKTAKILSDLIKDL